MGKLGGLLGKKSRGLSLEELGTTYGAEARSVVDRIRAVPKYRPLDRDRVEAALVAHLHLLGMDARPVVWVEPDEDADPESCARAGFLAAWDALGVKQPGETVRRSPCRDVLYGFYGPRTAAGLRRDVEEAEKLADRGTRHAAEKAADLVEELARRDAEWVGGNTARAAVWAAAQARGLRALGGIADSRTAQQRAAPDVESEVVAASAAHCAAAAAGWLSRVHVLEEAGVEALPVRRMAETYLSLLEALEGGLWLYWVTPDNVLAVAAPDSWKASIRIERPHEQVWQAFTDLRGWAVWHRNGAGGALEAVEPGWCTGATTQWALGVPGTISACVPGKSVTFSGGAPSRAPEPGASRTAVRARRC